MSRRDKPYYKQSVREERSRAKTQRIMDSIARGSRRGTKSYTYDLEPRNYEPYDVEITTPQRTSLQPKKGYGKPISSVEYLDNRKVNYIYDKKGNGDWYPVKRYVSGYGDYHYRGKDYHTPRYFLKGYIIL